MNKSPAQWAKLNIVGIFRDGRGPAAVALDQAITDIGELDALISKQSDLLAQMAHGSALKIAMIDALCQLARQMLTVMGETIAAGGMSVPPNLEAAKDILAKAEQACAACVKPATTEKDNGSPSASDTPGPGAEHPGSTSIN